MADTSAINLSRNYKYTEKPSRTYEIDFKNETITSNVIDGDDALAQTIKCILMTEYNETIIYNNYGLPRTLVYDKDILEAETERSITFALTNDDRIEECSDYEYEYPSKDTMHVTLTAVKTDGEGLDAETTVETDTSSDYTEDED